MILDDNVAAESGTTEASVSEGTDAGIETTDPSLFEIDLSTPEEKTDGYVDTSKFLPDKDPNAVEEKPSELEGLLKQFGVKDLAELGKRAEGWRKAVRDKAAALDDATLNDIITEKRGPGAPEKYEGVADMLKAAGLEPNDDSTDEGKASYEPLYNWAKKYHVPQDGLKELFTDLIGPTTAAVQQQWMEDVGLGLTKARKTEYVQQLTKEWGADASVQAAAVGKWAQSQLPEWMWKYPLSQTPGGMKQLKKWMGSSKGPNPITGNGSGNAVERAEIEGKMNAIMAKPTLNKLDHQMYDALAAQLRNF